MLVVARLSGTSKDVPYLISTIAKFHWSPVGRVVQRHGEGQRRRHLDAAESVHRLRVAAGHQARPVRVDAAAVLEALGRPKFYREAAARTGAVGGCARRTHQVRVEERV